MFEISVEQTFAAGHALRNYKGKCENVHGHNYRVQVIIRGEEVDPYTGMLTDFVELKRLLREISEPLDHVFLNDIRTFYRGQSVGGKHRGLYLREDAGRIALRKSGGSSGSEGMGDGRSVRNVSSVAGSEIEKWQNTTKTIKQSELFPGVEPAEIYSAMLSGPKQPRR